MKKIFVLKGLGCPCCSAAMEDAIEKIPEIESASINFFTQKLVIETKDEQDIDETINKIEKIISKIEPGCRLIK